MSQQNNRSSTSLTNVWRNKANKFYQCQLQEFGDDGLCVYCHQKSSGKLDLHHIIPRSVAHGYARELIDTEETTAFICHSIHLTVGDTDWVRELLWESNKEIYKDSDWDKIKEQLSQYIRKVYLP